MINLRKPFSTFTLLATNRLDRRFIMLHTPLFFSENASKNTNFPCNSSCDKPNVACTCTYIKNITTNKVIQFVIYNMGRGANLDGTAHPVHLHGRYPNYNKTTGYYQENNKDITCSDSDLCNNLDWENPLNKMVNVPYANFKSPPLKDTVFVPVGGYVVIRFYSDNPGYWFFHCHIEMHQAEGMSLIIQEGTNSEIRKLVDFNEILTCNKGFEKNLAMKISFKNDNGNILIIMMISIFLPYLFI